MNWRVAVGLVVIALIVGVFFKLYNREIEFNLIFFENSHNGKALSYGANPSLAERDFFTKVKERMVKEKVDFVEADLSEMKLKVYKDGQEELEVPILSKGREGSWWETPAGLYKIASREKNHFSSFGQVYMPWSMQFQGNFFIHGWPYYEGGKAVASTYSGGCIRLADEGAEAVYKLIDKETPVLVFEENLKNKGDFELVKQIETKVGAKSFLVADLDSGGVFLERQASEVLPIASITKLLTALITVEYINLENEITVAERMIVYTSKPRLKIGEKLSAFELLYPLLLESSNEAGEALTGFLGRDLFIQRMNEKAVALGMNSTKLVDPTGKGEGNVSTTEDLFNLLKYLYYNRQFVLDMSAGREKFTAYGRAGFDNLVNFNDFIKDGFEGGKIGQTIIAGETASMIYKIEINGEKRLIVVIVLGSEDREKDIGLLLEYLRNNY